MDDIIIRPVPGYSGLLADSTGQVWSTNGGRWGTRPPHRLAGFPNADGYVEVRPSIDGKSKTLAVHVLIAKAFLGPRPPGFHVCHRNGIKTENQPGNLMYGTPAENARQAVVHGTVARGGRQHLAKLTSEQVQQIAARRKAGERLIDLASEYGVSVSTISAAARGRTWRHLRVA